MPISIEEEFREPGRTLGMIGLKQLNPWIILRYLVLLFLLILVVNILLHLSSRPDTIIILLIVAFLIWCPLHCKGKETNHHTS
ncbi:MAG: hypothetical protein JXB14_07400 [Candidatus Altiarchaeota archaeon]|nr:hypothetical protein [Candidatus Altiarchaeota archaeon]